MDGKFAHIDYSGHLRSERSMLQRWESSWLTRFAKSNPLRGKPESVGARTLVDQFLLCEWECVLRRASSAVLVH